MTETSGNTAPTSPNATTRERPRPNLEGLTPDQVSAAVFQWIMGYPPKPPLDMTRYREQPAPPQK